MTALVDFRSDLHNNLASAADASRWPNALLDQALRLAVAELDKQLIYETSFTVAVAGYEQDLNGITAINSVLAVAYPWGDGSEFGRCVAAWRFSAVNKLYFVSVQPAVGEVIRVRYTKLHTIDDLDSASATTVPELHRVLVGLWAAGFACELRHRQSGEKHLAVAAERFRQRAQEAISHVPPLGRLRWGAIGLL